MRTFTFSSPRSKREVFLTMKELTNSNSQERLFTGDIKEDSFSVVKYKPFHNRFLHPTLFASVKENNGGTGITIKASLSKRDKIISYIFIAAICSICIYLAINGIISSSLEPLFPAIALLIFAAIICLLERLIFSSLAKKDINKLILKLTSQ